MKSAPTPILPGATVGVLGGGQLGRMFALAARACGYRVHIYTTESDAPAGQVADLELVGAYDDSQRLEEFARGINVVTFEFENVSATAAELISKWVPVRPAGSVLHISQHRLREKTFLREHGLPVTPFSAVRSLQELKDATGKIGFPGILKTAGFGYDGKGQIRINAEENISPAWNELKSEEAVYEKVVDFQMELSVVAARTMDGQKRGYPIFENSHQRHILDLTCCPARISPALAREAEQLAFKILDQLEVVGLLTVELFLTREEKLLVNELAPRPHNSGHLTIDAAITSQFEQQLRSICGLPLGSAELRAPAAMANLLGDLWNRGTPNWGAALSDPLVKLHLYGKSEARAGRKMGHLTAVGSSVGDALTRVRLARERLAAIP